MSVYNPNNLIEDLPVEDFIMSFFVLSLDIVAELYSIVIGITDPSDVDRKRLNGVTHEFGYPTCGTLNFFPGIE
jgi:hypothetical protein